MASGFFKLRRSYLAIAFSLDFRNVCWFVINGKRLKQQAQKIPNYKPIYGKFMNSPKSPRIRCENRDKIFREKLNAFLSPRPRATGVRK